MRRAVLADTGCPSLVRINVSFVRARHRGGGRVLRHNYPSPENIQVASAQSSIPVSRLPVAAALILAVIGPGVWLDEARAQQASHTGQTGLIQMPDARIGADGTFRLGYSFAEPYVAPLWASVSILPRVEVSARYTRIMRVPGFSDQRAATFGDFKDKSFDGKLVLWPEGTYVPQIAIGAQDFLGTQIFVSKYAVASKRIGDLDVTLGYGVDRIDGPFGGVRYRPKGLENWAFVAEYDANDYKRDPGSNLSGAAGIQKGPGFGIEYTWGWVTTQLSYTREKPGILAYVSVPLGEKDFIPDFQEPAPYVKVTPRPTISQWVNSDEHRQRMARALADQDFRSIRIEFVNNRVEVVLTNIRISQVSRAVGRAARTVLLLSPLGTREIRITYTVRDLPVVTYSFFELDKLQRYFNGVIPRWELAQFVAVDYATPGAHDLSADRVEMLKAFDEHQPGMRVLYQSEGDVVALQSADQLLNRIRIRSTLGTYFNDPSGAFKYNLGIQAGIDRNLGAGLFFSSTVNLSVLENVTDVTQPSNSVLPHVRTDVAEYVRASPLKVSRLLLNQFYHPAERVYTRLSGGLYEDMFGGFGGQALYLPRGAPWAVDLAVDWLQQRDFDGLGFRDYQTVTGIASFHYRLPLGVTTTARVGQFLARDKGVRFEFKRRFQSGWEVGAWYSFTDGKDITSPGTPDAPYRDKGIFLAIPLNTLLPRDTQASGSFSLAPWTRDVAQMVASPADLYQMVEKPLVLDMHAGDGLVRFGDKDDDYPVPKGRTLFDRPVLKGLSRDLDHSQQALSEERTWKNVAVGLGLVAASSALDRPADRFARDHGKNRFIETGADVGNVLPLFALAGAGFFALDATDQRRSDTSYTALQSSVTSAALALAMKYAVGRSRPTVGQGPGDFHPFSSGIKDKSFPSERTALMWGLVTPYAKEYEMPQLYVLAALTNFGRVADRRHWLSDTVGGALLGYATGSLLWHSHRKPERGGPRVGFTGNGVVLAWDVE